MALKQLPTLSVGSPVVWLCLMVLLEAGMRLTWQKKPDQASLGTVYMTITEFEVRQGIDTERERRRAVGAERPR